MTLIAKSTWHKVAWTVQSQQIFPAQDIWDVRKWTICWEWYHQISAVDNYWPRKNGESKRACVKYVDILESQLQKLTSHSIITKAQGRCLKCRQRCEFTNRSTFLARVAYFQWDALMHEGAFSKLFWQLYWKTCSHLMTNIIKSKFTDVISESWGFYTPTPHASNATDYMCIEAISM